MEKETMKKAFRALDGKLKMPAKILIGGGAAILLAHGMPLATMDIDGILVESAVTPAELDPLVKKVARELGINPHWFNSYFGTFTHTIPPDYKKRLVPVYNGRKLTVFALGLEELLIMKCFAGREKDIGHVRELIRKGADLGIVESHMEALLEKGLPGAGKALEFFGDLKSQEGL